MKKTGIMTDSHSGILNEEAERLGIKVLPMPFYIGEKVYREGVDLSRDEFYDMLRKGVDVSTSQPSPTEVMDMWKEMLEEYEEIVYIPLSSGLSGSCMSAQAMANEEKFAGKVFVVDNGRVATPMHRSVLDAVEMVEKGYIGAEIKKILEEYIEQNGLAGQLEASLSEDGLMVRIKDTALFESGRADLLPQSRVFAGAVAKMLAPLPQRIFVSGHTDNVPINTAEFPTNWDLSTRRALNFMKFLLTQEPASKAERFSVTGFGEYQPIAPNTTTDGRATNRRVEILIMRNNPVRSQ